MNCQITFLGAAGTVTGSSYLVETENVKFLVDCGLFQEGPKTRALNYAPFAFDPKSLDFVILTHAHLDHCGLLPKLTKEGFSGPIYCTPPTKDLAKLILTDAAQIQEHGVRDEDIELLFSKADANQAASLFKAHRYNMVFKPSPNLKASFRDAGHILGSSMVELWVGDIKIVFSGDLGNYPIPVMKTPTFLTEADYIICESTYGDRTHPSMKNRVRDLLAAVRHAKKIHGKIIIPSFALERSQELIYTFNQLYNQNLLGNIQIVLDSPLASSITKVYKKYTDYFDEEFQTWLKTDPDLFHFKTFRETITREQSMELNNLQGEAVFIAGSGMADAGRVQHHLRHQLADHRNQIVFVGFCAPGTLGRKLIDGASRVRIKDHMIPVKAQIRVIGSFSAHADQTGLLNWLSYFKNSSGQKKPTVFLTHGETTPRAILKKHIETKLGFNVKLPHQGQSINL